MKITKQSRRDARELLHATLVDGVMDAGRVRQAVQLVLERKPRGYFAILEHFKRLVKLEEDRRDAKVESAIALSPDQRASVSAGLARLYGQGLNISFQQSPGLIGGLRVRVGSDVYDGSVASRLARLEEAF